MHGHACPCVLLGGERHLEPVWELCACIMGFGRQVSTKEISAGRSCSHASVFKRARNSVE